MEAYEIGNLVSLWLTPVTLVSCIVVMYYFRPSFITAVQSQSRTSLHWFIIGICISFAATTIDNAFWTVSWAAEYLGHPAAHDLYVNGVYPNIVFRQVGGILAAICHIKGVTELPEQHSVLKRTLLGGIALGTVFVGSLMVIA